MSASNQSSRVQPDLNALRGILQEAQKSENTKPKKKKDKVFVDGEGGIRQGQDVSSSEARQFSEVQPDEFKGLFSKTPSRLSKDRQTVRDKMPANTREVKTPEGVTGWIYRFKCELGNNFSMFAYFDGAFYQVQVLEPQLEKKWHSPHTGHIFDSGEICMGDGYRAGRPTLESAYAKSVLWATGISVALRTGKFPFNANQ